MNAIDVQATRGAPYRVTRDRTGIVRLSRKVAANHDVFLMFSRDDAVAVCNALIDILEAAE